MLTPSSVTFKVLDFGKAFFENIGGHGNGLLQSAARRSASVNRRQRSFTGLSPPRPPSTKLAFQFSTDLPTGNFGKGLGTAHVSLEPALLLTMKMTPDCYFQAEMAYWIPIAGDPLFSGPIWHNHLSFNHLLRQVEDGGLSPSHETTAPHGALTQLVTHRQGAAVVEVTGLIPARHSRRRSVS